MRVEANPTAASEAQTSATATSGDGADALFQRVLDQSRRAVPAQSGIALASLIALHADGSAEFEIDGLGRVRAVHSLVPLGSDQIGRTLALGFDQGEGTTPVVLGPVVHPASAVASAPELRVDGQRVIIEAEREIELRCGEAAIVLGADGHIQLRGTYITSQASATQRIQGGSVNVN